MFPTSPAGQVSVAAFPGAMLSVGEGPGCPGQAGSATATLDGEQFWVTVRRWGLQGCKGGPLRV